MPRDVGRRSACVRDTDSVRKPERRGSAGLRQAVAEGVAAYIADDDAEVFNLIDAAIKQDALAAALNLTALAGGAVAALAARTGQEPEDVVRALRQQGSQWPVASPEPANPSSDSLSGVQVVYPDTMDDFDWEMTKAKGWIEVTIRWAGGHRVITFYDPIRLAQEVHDAIAQPGYFAAPTLVVVPTLTRDAIEAAVTAIARRNFMDVS